MEFLRIISGPLIGGIIGYITNYIAIKMLFRPLRPIMIGKFRVPFTPGIVPKRKDKLAVVLGNAIVAKFFNADDLEILFTSDSFKNAVADNIVNSLYNDASTSVLSDTLRNEDYAPIISNIKEALCSRIQAGIIRSGISGVIAEEGGRLVAQNFSNGVMGKFINQDTISVVAEPLGELIEKTFEADGRAIIMPLLDDEFAVLAEEPMSSLASGIVPDRDMLHKVVCSIYTKFMSTHVRPIVESIDVGGMITEKIILMDAGDIEGLVLDVVNRELHYVVLLGALLGVVIGTVNIFI